MELRAMTCGDQDPMPQHMLALEEANRVRYARADVKRDVKAGRMNAEDAFEHWACQNMPLGELLRSQPRWGYTRARKFLQPMMISESRKLRHLTARQRVALIAALETNRGIRRPPAKLF